MSRVTFDMDNEKPITISLSHDSKSTHTIPDAFQLLDELQTELNKVLNILRDCEKPKSKKQTDVQEKLF